MSNDIKIVPGSPALKIVSGAPAAKITRGPFHFSITTTTTPQTFTLPLVNGGTYAARVFWGDGQSSEITAWDDASKAHSYATAGTYEIKIFGTFKGWAFNNGGDKTLIKDIKRWGCLGFTNTAGAFHGCSNLTVSATDILNTAGLTTMQSFFNICSSFNSVLNIDTANITNMYYLFAGCSSFNQSVANFNTAKVTSMKQMFQNCKLFNQSVANFNTAKVIDTSYMFSGCSSFNQSVASFNIGAMATAIGFMGAVTLSTANYDATLIAWEAQTEKPNVTIGFGSSKYTAGGAAAAARAALVANGWIITDGGTA